MRVAEGGSGDKLGTHCEWIFTAATTATTTTAAARITATATKTTTTKVTTILCIVKVSGPLPIDQMHKIIGLGA